jgi:protein SCO1
MRATRPRSICQFMRRSTGSSRAAWERLLGAAVISLGLCLSPARGDEVQIALDHPFSLVDADDNTVTSSDFAGKWLLIYFGYTHCTDECPTSLSGLAEALDQIGPAARYLQPIFVTVDPERDHGPMLREFTTAFDKRIIGLTGTAEQIADLAGALGVKYEKVLLGDSDYVVDHSTKLSLVYPQRKSAVSFAFAEPYLIAAELLRVLDRAGVALGDVKNLGAYR